MRILIACEISIEVISSCRIRLHRGKVISMVARLAEDSFRRARISPVPSSDSLEYSQETYKIREIIFRVSSLHPPRDGMERLQVSAAVLRKVERAGNARPPILISVLCVLARARARMFKRA